jgi:hypothetical protein
MWTAPARAYYFAPKLLQVRELTRPVDEFSRRGGGYSDNRVLHSGPDLVKNKEAASGCMGYGLAGNVQAGS